MITLSSAEICAEAFAEYGQDKQNNAQSLHWERVPFLKRDLRGNVSGAGCSVVELAPKVTKGNGTTPRLPFTPRTTPICIADRVAAGPRMRYSLWTPEAIARGPARPHLIWRRRPCRQQAIHAVDLANLSG